MSNDKRVKRNAYLRAIQKIPTGGRMKPAEGVVAGAYQTKDIVELKAAPPNIKVRKRKNMDLAIKLDSP